MKLKRGENLTSQEEDLSLEIIGWKEQRLKQKPTGDLGFPLKRRGKLLQMQWQE